MGKKAQSLGRQVKNVGINNMEYECENCCDTGYTTIIEWANEDDSYEVEVLCECNEE